MANQKQYVVGIDLGSHITRVIVTEPPVREGVFPRVLGFGRAEAGGMRHGYVVNVDEASRSLELALRAAEKSAGVEIKKAYLSLGGIGLASEILVGSHMVSRADQEVTDLDIGQAIRTSEESFIARNRNRKILHTIPLRYRLDGEEVLATTPIGLHGKRLEVRIACISCQKHHYDDLVRVATDAGIKIIDVIASPLALSIATLTRRQKTVGCGLVDIGAETVSLSIFENDALVSLEVFPIGSMDITNDLALGFRVPLSEAELIKLGKDFGSLPKRKIEDIIEARLFDIFELVENHLKKIRRDGLLPAGIILTGGGSNLSSLEQISRATLKLPAAIIKVEHAIQGRRDLDTSWLTAYGLCILGDGAPTVSPGDIGRAFSKAKKTLSGFFEQFLP